MHTDNIVFDLACEKCWKKYNGIYFLCIPCMYKEKEKLALEMFNDGHKASIESFEELGFCGGEFENEIIKERKYATDIVHRKWFNKDWELNYK